MLISVSCRIPSLKDTGPYMTKKPSVLQSDCNCMVLYRCTIEGNVFTWDNNFPIALRVSCSVKVNQFRKCFNSIIGTSVIVGCKLHKRTSTTALILLKLGSAFLHYQKSQWHSLLTDSERLQETRSSSFPSRPCCSWSHAPTSYCRSIRKWSTHTKETPGHPSIPELQQPSY